MRETPKYKIIENYITEKINTGELKPGQQIETEKQLQEKFKIGHITVNKALNNLATKGYINRTAGRGSFVNNKMVIKNNEKVSSFTEDIKSLGMKPGSKLIKYEIIKALDEPKIKEYLQLEDNDLIHYFIRVRTADDVAIAVSYTYISAKLIPAIDINSLEGSLKEYLDKIGFKQNVSSYHMMKACLPNSEQKKLLNVDNVALLNNSHITFTEDKIPYEYVSTYYLCDRYKYTFSRN